MHGGFQVFLGLDVGKEGHHAVALDRDGKRLHDAAMVDTEARLRQVFGRLAEHGPVLVVVDQPASIGALPVAVARAAGLQVACLPGLAMRRIADRHPGQAKTDARDAYVIADAARTLPHTLRRVDVGEETRAELEVLVGYKHLKRAFLPRCLRQPGASNIAGLIRPQTRPRQTPQRRPHLPFTPPRRRPVRHAPRPPALPNPADKPRSCRLTKPIGTPPPRSLARAIGTAGRGQCARHCLRPGRAPGHHRPAGVVSRPGGPSGPGARSRCPGPRPGRRSARPPGRPGRAPPVWRSSRPP